MKFPRDRDNRRLITFYNFLWAKAQEDSQAPYSHTPFMYTTQLTPSCFPICNMAENHVPACLSEAQSVARGLSSSWASAPSLKFRVSRRTDRQEHSQGKKVLRKADGRTNIKQENTWMCVDEKVCVARALITWANVVLLLLYYNYDDVYLYWA